MPFDGSGTFDRVHNFSADASAGIQAQATRFDAELDGMATGLENCQTLTGETTPTADSPMGGFKHTGVAAATSTDNYLRADQSSNQVGIYVRDTNTGVTGTISASAAVFPTAFTDGQRVTVKVSADGSTSAPRAIIVNGVSANIVDNKGNTVPASHMFKDGIFDLVYDSSASAFRLLNTNLADVLQNSVVIKSAATNSSSETVVADGELAGLPYLANKNYKLEAYLPYNQNKGDIKFRFAADTALQTSGMSIVAIDQSGNSELKNIINITTTAEVSTLADAVQANAVITGRFLTNAATAGSLELQFSRVVSATANTVLQAGAFMQITQLD